MKHNLKKLLSILLAFSLLASLLTVTAMASEGNGWKEEKAAVEAILDLMDDETSLLAQYQAGGNQKILNSADAGSTDKAFTYEVEVPVLMAALPEELPALDLPSQEPVDEPIETPAGEPSEEPAETPAEELSEAPAETPAEEPSEEPAETPAEEPSEAPAETPAEEPSEAPAETPVEEPSENPAETPAEEPSEEPVETPAEEPAEEPDTANAETIHGISTQFSEGPEESNTVTVTLGEVAGEVNGAPESAGISMSGMIWRVYNGNGKTNVFFGYLAPDEAAADVLLYASGSWKCGAAQVSENGVLLVRGSGTDENYYGESGDQFFEDAASSASFDAKLRLFGEDGEEIVYETADLVVGEEGTYRISGYGNHANNIVIQADAAITLDNVTVEDLDSGLSAIRIETGVSAAIEVDGECLLVGGNGGSGIEVPAGSSVTVSGNSLTAAGTGNRAAGIGAHNSGDITIRNLDSLVAVGGQYGVNTASDNGPEGGAGIGGGTLYEDYSADGLSKITLKNCGTVEAYGGSKAAGIGSRFWNACDIEITDSSVYAEGGATSPAIGTARNTYRSESDAGTITADVVSHIVISGSAVEAVGGYYGAGIGSGYNDKCLGDFAREANAKQTSVSVEIKSGSDVTATGGKLGAGIGGGYKNFGDSVSISGGCTVTAYAGQSGGDGKKIASGIGSGADGSSLFSDSGAQVSIARGAEVYAFSYGYDAMEPLASKWAVSRELEDEATSATVLQFRFLVADTFHENDMDLYSEDIGVLSPSKDHDVTITGAGESYTAEMPAGYTSLAATVEPGTYRVTVDGKAQSSPESIAWSAESGNGTAYGEGVHADGTYAGYALTYKPWNSADGYEATIRYTFGAPSADFTVSSGVNSFDAVAYRPGVEPTQPTGFQVTYQWTGEMPANTAKPLGASVDAGASYTPDASFTSATTLNGTYQNQAGAFSFSGWDRTATFTVNEDVTIHGVWSFTPGGSISDGDTESDGRDDNSDRNGGNGQTTIPDEQTPTTDLPDEQTPIAEAPVTNLPEELVPLAEVPETGDCGLVWMLTAAASLAGLAALSLTGKKKEA